MERIILAFPKDETAHRVQSMLDGTSFSVEMICHSCAEIIRSYLETDGAIVLMSYKLTDGTCDDVFESLPPQGALMTITKAENIENIRNTDIFTIPLPINRMTLIGAIETYVGTTMQRRKRPKRSDADSELLNQAKLTLMEKYLMTEQQAHRFIQKRSMNTGATIVDTAKLILCL